MSSQLKRELKQLEQEWYKKLEESGFEDIEDTSHKARPLKDWHSFYFVKKTNRKSNIDIEAIEIYNYKAKELLLTYEFEKEIHRKIWELHCDGLCETKIERAINHIPGAPKRETIRKLVKLIASEII